MDFHIIIPARLGSTRLPGKVLLDVNGKPLIQLVHERALQCGAQSVTIATDDERVYNVAKDFGAKVCMTDSKHENGTERLSEAVRLLNLTEDTIVVNIQGDEPLVPPTAVLKAVKAMSENPIAAMATLCTPIREEGEMFDPNIPKVVLDKNNYAMYFSRAPIPWDRKRFGLGQPTKRVEQVFISHLKNNCYRHIGLYAYRAKTLKRYFEWEKSPLEDLEFLEQLRILWQGEKVYVSVIEEPLPPGVDTEADLIRLRRLLENA